MTALMGYSPFLSSKTVPTYFFTLTNLHYSYCSLEHRVTETQSFVYSFKKRT